MKKMMIAALMVLGTSTAFAGDSEALKAIMKAKTYAEASALVKSSLDQLATPAEKAKAYNHLVKLSQEKVDAENAVMQANVQAQLEKKDPTPYDTIGLYNASYNLLLNAIECDKYDQMPDEKGKVKPRYGEVNRPLALAARINLIGAGNAAAGKGDQDGVLKYWGTFLDTDDNAFLQVDKASEQTFIGQVAYFTALYANQAKQLDKALKYCDIAALDPQQAKEAINLKFSIGQSNLKTKADTLKYIDELNDFYAKNPDSEAAFGTLCNLYSSIDKKEEVNKLVEERIAKDPNNATAWALKGQNEMNEASSAEKPDWDKPIETFKKCIEIDGTNAVVLTYLGFCINSKAATIENNRNVQKEMYRESLGYLERAREIDPNRDHANWAYPLYQCYYLVYSADDPRTKEMEEILKVK
ncbi:MAG: hypothetical protein IJS97_02930 [Prevotella sp.]|nr:hypothetical protein [Prevotella sp.]